MKRAGGKKKKKKEGKERRQLQFFCFFGTVSDAPSAGWMAEILFRGIHYIKQISQQDRRMPVQMALALISILMR